ncbi:MAG: vWA domain-containing protein [Candidatus Margulisiibacteriota bacterium]
MIRKLGILLLVLSVGVSIVGCAKLASTFTSTKDPGRLTSPEGTVSAVATYSGGKVTVNLSSLIISGEVKTLDKDRLKVFSSITAPTTSVPITGWDSLDFSFVESSTERLPADVVFILDNTGSMSSRIVAVKNSIAGFAATLEAAGMDVAFGAIAFGDYSKTKSAMAGQPVEFSSLDIDGTTTTDASATSTTNATTLATWLNALSGFNGYDGPENPLDALKYAYSHFHWRSGSQKIFVLITDIECHMNIPDSGNYPSGDTTKSPISENNIPDMVSTLSGKATVHVVSYDYTSATTPEGDTRDLADGRGGGKTTAEAVANTGGKWIELPASGNIDLNTLGISAYVTSGKLVRFDYSLSSGSTIYIHVLIDYNLDGVYDAEWYGTLLYTAAGESIRALGAPAPEGRRN